MALRRALRRRNDSGQPPSHGAVGAAGGREPDSDRGLRATVSRLRHRALRASRRHVPDRGLLHAIPAALISWLVLRRGFAVNSLAAGLAIGTLAGMAGVSML